MYATIFEDKRIGGVSVASETVYGIHPCTFDRPTDRSCPVVERAESGLLAPKFPLSPRFLLAVLHHSSLMCSYVIRAQTPVPSTPPSFSRQLLPDTPGFPTPTNEEQRLVIGDLKHWHSVNPQGKSGQERNQLSNVTIDILPDIVLIEIFDLYINNKLAWFTYDEWHSLVQVCRRWRYLVFASPRRLRLQLRYTKGRSVTKMPDIWPHLPITISQSHMNMESFKWSSVWSFRLANIVALLNSEHRHRISQISLEYIPNRLWQELPAAMEEALPGLTELRVVLSDDEARVLPNSFLGGSAPRLQGLHFERMPCPKIQRLLLSANNLVTLYLWRIPHSGYIPPDTIVTLLSALTRLNKFQLGFQSPRSRPDPASRRPPPLARPVLTALTEFVFQGVSEYLEDITACIDAPHLYRLEITFFMCLVFDVPHLHRFISCAEELMGLREAEMDFFPVQLEATTLIYHLTEDSPTAIRLQIRYRESDRRLLSSMCQLCHSSLPFISSLERFKIHDRGMILYRPGPHENEDMVGTSWLAFLESFIAIKDLYLYERVAIRVSLALQDLATERVTEVLPALQNFYIEGFWLSEEAVPEIFGQFVTLRELSGQPVAVHYVLPWLMDW